MEYKQHDILPDVWVMEPKKFTDDRGYFMETWRKADFEAHLGYAVEFVQENESKSTFGVLRGLHYQKGDASQAKLVRALRGRVVDVAVDLRQDSSTFGKYAMVELDAEKGTTMFVPRGFAHGFMVLSDEAVFCYKVDNRYAPEAECSIAYNDPTLAIQWPDIPADQLVLSEKDLRRAVSFLEAEKF